MDNALVTEIKTENIKTLFLVPNYSSWCSVSHKSHGNFRTG